MNVNYNRLVDIAKSAYGSGALEKSKGGNGYIGQYTDAAGQTHVVKMLTHKSERTAHVRSSGGADTEEMARATNDLKAKLIEIAGGEGTELGGKIKQMLESAQKKAVSEHMTAGEAGVGLLSRKIVAQAVTAIAEKTTFKNDQGQDVTFSWKDINGTNRAATVKNTKANAVNDMMARESAFAEAVLIEDMQKKKWANPLTSDQRGKGGFDFGSLFTDALCRMKSLYEKTDTSKSVVQRLKEAFAADGKDFNRRKNFSFLLGNVPLEDELFKLDENLSAEDVLEKLRDALNNAAPQNTPSYGVLALRVLLEEISIYETYGVSAKTLHACGMNAADFEQSVSAMAEKFHLPDAKKQSVGRVIASYLTALAEEGKTGRVDANGRPTEGLPSKDELKRQIADGTFGGAYFGLLHVRALCVHEPQIQSPDRLFNDLVSNLAGLLTDAECADAAYFIAKIGTGRRTKIPGDNQLSVLVLRKLLDKREEIMSLRQENGKLSINDISRVIGGPSEFEVDDKGTSIAMTLNDFFEEQLYDKILTRYPGAAKEWKDRANFAVENLGTLMAPMGWYGVSEDVAVKLFLGEKIDNLQVSDKASAYDVNSDTFVKANAQTLSDQIDDDMYRIKDENSIITVGSGDKAYKLVVPPEAQEDFADANTPMLMKKLSRLAGGGGKIGNPVPNQLKTMCFMCGQAGNDFLTMVGLNAVDCDRRPVDKSFTRQEDGSVLYTASSVVNGVTHTVKFQIETDGSSHLVDYSRDIAAELQETVKARLDKLTDFVNVHGTKSEKANLAKYQDGIVTVRNVQTLSKKVQKAFLGRSAFMMKKVTAGLMGLFAEINLRQAAKGQPLDSFETLMSRYAGDPEQIRSLDFFLTSKQVREAPAKMKTLLSDGFVKRKGEKKFHDKTNVHVMSLQEFGKVKVTINGVPPPDKPSETVEDGDRKITVADLQSSGETGDSGADTGERQGFHEALIKTFPNRDVRAFVSFLVSKSQGVKGKFNLTGDKNAAVANGPTASLLFAHSVNSNGGQVRTMSLNDGESNVICAITVEPDKHGLNGAVKKGGIKLVVSSSEGMCIYAGSDLEKLKLGNEDKLAIDVVRQKYETTVTIDPNVIDGNGIPSFTVGKPVLK